MNASQTILNDPEDEIIYFTYDFGDGEVKKNLTQGIITHTYTYNYEKENGVYTPKVSIITKNGKEMTFTASPNPNVLVKKQQVELEISSPSHPTSIVQINEKVQLLAEFNKLPEKMIRNFGDETPEVECKGRACYEVSHKYEKVGKYTITVTLQMEDGQSVDKTMAIKVNKK